MKITFLIAAFCVLSAAPALAHINAVTELGCEPNDPTFDNGARITAAIRDGRLTDTLHFPGGVYYHSTTIDDGAKEGLRFTGQGLAQWLPEGEHAAHRRGSSPVIFVYTGPADQPAWRLRGFGSRLEGLNLWRGFLAKPDWDGSVALELARAVPGPPSGKHNLGPISVCGFDTALAFVGPSHADSTDVSYLLSQYCRTTVVCTNSQTTCVNFGYIGIHGDGETVFDINRGGNFLIGTLALVEPRLIFRLQKTSSNTCTYSIQNLKVDNNAGRSDDGQGGWRLVSMQRAGPLNLYVRGQIGMRAHMGERPIVLTEPKPTRTWKPGPHYQHLDVELWGGPQGLWRPSAADYR